MKNKKYNGGPILTVGSPIESTSIKPVPIKSFDPRNFRLDPDKMIADFQQRNPLDLTKPFSMQPLTENYSSKSMVKPTKFREKSMGGLTKDENKLVKQLQKLLSHKENDVFDKEYSLGGQVLSTLAGMVPGIGGILSPAISLIDQQITKDQSQPSVPSVPMNLNTNIFGSNKGKSAPGIGIPTPKHLQSNGGMEMLPDGTMGTISYNGQMAKGGMITKDFKQYNTGSHASGNDTPINENGVPSANATASIQNKENAYSTKLGETYVYSDVLSNPETGNKFNMDASKLNKKFNKADVSIEDKNALEFGMQRLSLLNDKVRSIKEAVEMACGGKVKKMESGGNPKKTYSIYDDMPNNDLLDAELSVPLTDNILYSQPMGEMIDPTVSTLNRTVYDTSILPATTSRNSNNTLPDLNGLISTEPVKTRNMSTVSNSDFNYNIPAMILKGTGLAKSAVDALTPPEVESTILPDYRKSDEQMYSTNIDYTQAKQDALAAANLAGNVNRSASGSFEQMQGRQANNYANYADAVGRISMREALDRNQQYVQRAGYEQGKAVDTANRNTQNRINNQQNAAVADLADQKFFSELTDVGTKFNQYQVYRDMVTNKKEIAAATINEGLALIGSKYSNFGFTEDFMERIKSGSASIDEMVKFISTTEKIKSSTKTTN